MPHVYIYVCVCIHSTLVGFNNIDEPHICWYLLVLTHTQAQCAPLWFLPTHLCVKQSVDAHAQCCWRVPLMKAASRVKVPLFLSHLFFQLYLLSMDFSLSISIVVWFLILCCSSLLSDSCLLILKCLNICICSAKNSTNCYVGIGVFLVYWLFELLNWMIE